jgi:hypothetical protein
MYNDYAMTNSKRRFKKHRKHTFAGQSEGVPLVEWLNSPNQDAERDEFANILRLSGEIREQVKARGMKSVSDFLDNRDLAEKNHELNGLLALYPFRLIHNPDIGEGASFDYLPFLTPKSAWAKQSEHAAINREHGIKLPYSAALAFADMMVLGEKGLLSSVRQCFCGKWIFAKFPQEKHCCPQHRLEAHRAKPDFEKRRKEWRKGNHGARKALAQGALKRARRSQ